MTDRHPRSDAAGTSAIPGKDAGPSLRYRLGIDIGGTFTDLCLLDEATGGWTGLKTPTVPSDLARGVANGLELLERRGVRLGSIEYFVHGTTIGLNTVIQRTAPPVALVVTRGFRDLLEIGRLRLPIPWNFYSRRATPLIPRECVLELSERMLHSGASLVEPSVEDLERTVDQALDLGVEAIAICLLHSYANPEHELALKEHLLRRAPSLSVSCSAEIWPQIREYERALATVINAYIRPAMVRYLDGLERILEEKGVAARPYLTRSNGGIMTATSTREEPIQTLLSGPASGVLGASRAGLEAGFDNLITFDVGGTSADVAVVVERQIGYSREEHVGDFPVILPAIGISSIGAGGGSVAWIDGSGVLHVGPRSAGANPGPACYGMGGLEPTLTDAFVVSGYLRPERFAGEHRLDAAAAERAMEGIGSSLGRDMAQAADAIIRVALSNMYTELSGVLERKGLDPRDFTLVAFGGAGPLLACLLAEEANVGRVLVPSSPGTLCALGALEADVMSDFIRSVHWPLTGLPKERLAGVCDDLEVRARAWLRYEAPPVADVEFHWSADMRYEGQSYEIDVPVPGRLLREAEGAAIGDAFHRLHVKLFAHCDPAAPVEVAAIRLRAVGLMPRSRNRLLVNPARRQAEAISRRDIVYRGDWMSSRIYSRDDLASGHSFAGPAVVEQSDSTCLVPGGWRAAVDERSNLLLMRDGKAT